MADCSACLQAEESGIHFFYFLADVKVNTMNRTRFRDGSEVKNLPAM